MKNDPTLSERHAKQIAAGLARVLADSARLYLKTHGYHWNVEGPQFRSIHLLLEEQYREIWAALDTVAERIRALGHYAPASLADFAELSTIEEDRGVPSAPDMLARLAADNETVVRTLREVRATVDEAGDGATATLLDDRLAAHEKHAWMLRSMLREPGEVASTLQRLR